MNTLLRGLADSSFIAQIIVLILIGFSVVSWGIILFKSNTEWASSDPHRNPMHGIELSRLIKSTQSQAEVTYLTALICIEATTIPR